MKRVLSVLLAVCLIVGCLPLVVSAEEETSGTYGDNVLWSYDADLKTLTISGTGGNQFSPDKNCVRGQIVTFLYRYSK